MTDPRDGARSTRLAEQLAQRLKSDQAYFAHLFSVLQSVEGLDAHGVANALGAPLDQLPRIALCRTPRDDMFKEDVDAIAEHFALDPDRLARVVRQGQLLTAFTHAGSGELLAAARDHVAEESENYAADEDQTNDGSAEDETTTSESGEDESGGDQ